MRVKVGGQRFDAGQDKINVSVFTHSREKFEVEANKLLALDPAEFGEHDVYSSGSHAWVSRDALDGTVEVTIFAASGVTEQDIIDHLGGA